MGILEGLNDQVAGLLLLLSERERFVIEKRFALTAGEKATLEEIGQHFSVTRERVRQIEKNALQKLTRNVSNFDVIEINNFAFEILQNNGGVLDEIGMLSKLLNKSTRYSVSALLFILSLDKRFVRLSNTINYYPYFKVSSIDGDVVNMVVKSTIDILEEKGDVMSIADLRDAVLKNRSFDSGLTERSFASIFVISKQLKVMESSVGLIKWKHIHPRTLRDKIFFVLRREKKALHFVDIANMIVSASFDKKNVNLQAVHNELIRHADFILIGRGIYALKEWGFNSGTVAEIIKSILSTKKELSEEEIIAEVLMQRQVKPITIILNLKNKPQFVRTGRKHYKLKK